MIGEDYEWNLLWSRNELKFNMQGPLLLRWFNFNPNMDK